MDNVIRLIRERLMQPTHIDGPDMRVSNPALKRAGDLGPGQLAWLRENVHGFGVNDRQAEAARAHSEQSKVRT